MRILSSCGVVLAIALSALPVSAADSLEERLESAAVAYRASGVEGFAEALLTDSMLSEQLQFRVGIIGGMQQLESVFGAFEEIEILRTVPVGTRGALTILSLIYEDGIGFAFASGFRHGDRGWIVQTFHFHSDPQHALPIADFMAVVDPD